ncbi:alkyl hydroperoxide reductase/ Thiol specific antioxidant/ Mal allergen [Natrinema pellirubrum DSM 15624]|uniref:Alkyl hydroperoxide reductase/ Thiol specific antioxidant/ Mal allergen n=1 Tax=Natrinema pellirubrum (strain DSM 15624 / CIP 106293 / JCM 10476 / NCIMB 786 / 157) TaxID=797303 RepID=L0JMZ4_NATP1|nr:thioredoxin family protein [Natrinema pellirubrum]AGB32213.1 Peroxiredoxin [Natrinema pellirubrum DSM 15624]ELY74992.1 alkyl hydroperoxide reductase/ Thiol specific antioxidant/ Mal allergen [Natrinema pellirubrum DSM 15624]
MVLQESDSELEAGDPAPEFDLEGVDGETYSLDSFADDEALLVVFTCNHCPYAQAKFDLLNELAAEYDDVSVVGINPNDAAEYPDDSFEKMEAFVDEGKIEYDAYLRDESQAVARAYGAVCTPDPFLFEREDGTFRLAYHGRLDDAPNPDDEPSRFQIREAIDAVLAGESLDLEWQPSRGCSIKWKED